MTTTIVKPTLPSSVVRFSGQSTLAVPASLNDTVAVVGTHNRGPIATPKRCRTLMEYEGIFGQDASQLRTAVVGAFVGQNVPGGAGAGEVIVIRLATSAAAPASKVNIQNTTPATALTLTALTPGTYGNDISYVIEDDPLDATKDRLRILFRGVEVEKFSYAQTNIASLAAAIVARPSRYVTATAPITGVALTPTAGTSLTGGNDGAAVTATEYAAAQDALEFENFTAFGAAALTDAAVKVQLATWVKRMENEMRPIRLVIGGAAGETVDTAIAELAANPTLRDPQVIRLAVGTWHDDVLNADLSTAQLVGRTLGVLAARGLKSALTRSLYGGITPVAGTGPSSDELAAGRDAGLTMLRRVSNPNAEVAISQGVTTFIDTTVADRPLVLWQEPRLVGLFNATIRRIVEWGDDIVIGDLPVTDDTRNLVRKEVRKILDEYEGSGLAEPGSSFVTVEDPEDASLADAIPFDFGFVPTRTANFLIGTGRVR